MIENIDGGFGYGFWCDGKSSNVGDENSDVRVTGDTYRRSRLLNPMTIRLVIGFVAEIGDLGEVESEKMYKFRLGWYKFDAVCFR